MKRSSNGRIVPSCSCIFHDKKQDDLPLVLIEDQIPVIQERIKSNNLRKSEKSKNMCLGCIGKIIDENFESDTTAGLITGLLRGMDKEIKEDIKGLFELRLLRYHDL